MNPHLAPTVSRLGANRKLAAQINGFRQPQPGTAALSSGTKSSGLADGELQMLRHFLAGLGRR